MTYLAKTVLSVELQPSSSESQYTQRLWPGVVLYLRYGPPQADAKGLKLLLYQSTLSIRLINTFFVVSTEPVTVESVVTTAVRESVGFGVVVVVIGVVVVVVVVEAGGVAGCVEPWSTRKRTQKPSHIFIV